MKIAITGSRGFIGTALVPSLTAAGHQVIRLVRSEQQRAADTIYWSPATAYVDTHNLEGIQAVIHLAGEQISGRWTPAKKKKILTSRVQGTRLLAEALVQLRQPPQVMVCASAIGFYGNRGEEWLQEESPPGSGFLAEVCQEWEAASEPAANKGIRVVRLRTGIVLGTQGGALAQMLPPFRMGVGGVIGPGDQYMSWIALDDLIGAYQHALTTLSLQGPVNAVSPNPVTNREFTKTLGSVLSRPTVFPMPSFAVRLAFGEMGVELLLSSARVRPARLLSSGYPFRYAELESALRHVLGQNALKKTG
ncbi:MAG: TIGR01777 family protein [Acidobacteria bacterium]|nr:TIGR01777 family protein [Acidobacteriota bacterium]